MSKTLVIERASCPSCPSSDAFHVWEDEDKKRDGYCFSCEKFFKQKELNKLNLAEEEEAEESVEDFNTIKNEYPSAALTDRGISKQIAQRFGVKAGFDQATRTITEHFYPMHKNGHLVAYKKRKIEDKSFSVIRESDTNLRDSQLFGQHLCGEGGKMLIVTEGECDAMAAHQMMFEKFGKTYRVCSLPNGANLSAFKAQLEWLETFEKVILCFDQDEKGQKAAQEACALLSLGKGRVMNFSEKDANDMLLKNKAAEFYEALTSSQPSKPDGIVSGTETWEMLQNRPEVEFLYFPENWSQLNAMTYGMRLGELDTWTSGTGMGKTQVMKELMYHIIQTSDDPLGIIFLEEPLEDTVESLMGLHMNKRIHLPDVRKELTQDELYQAWLATAGNGQVHFANTWAEDSGGQNLLSKIRYFAKGLGCKRIILDHLHMITTEDGDNNEVNHIDRLMSKIKGLTRELNIWIGLVVHLRKGTNGAQSFETGAVPTLDDLRGSSSIKQLSNSVYALARNQQAYDEDVRNTTGIHVLKCRFTGQTGPGGFLRFDPVTGRMYACGDPGEFQAFNKEE